MVVFNLYRYGWRSKFFSLREYYFYCNCLIFQFHNICVLYNLRNLLNPINYWIMHEENLFFQSRWLLSGEVLGCSGWVVTSDTMVSWGYPTAEIRSIWYRSSSSVFVWNLRTCCEALVDFCEFILYVYNQLRSWSFDVNVQLPTSWSSSECERWPTRMHPISDY